eukprot:Clim_evm75s152 gene=Clim_evmTU75s152
MLRLTVLRCSIRMRQPASGFSAWRYFATSNQSNGEKEKYRCLEYREYGVPSDVLRMELGELSTMEEQSVMIKMLMAPLNPADINQIEGMYPIKPPLPAVAGNEGVGEVIAVGNQVTSLQVGDRVIPAKAGWGTWRTRAIAHSNELLKVSKDLNPMDAACLSVNPCTAYRMLKDFVDLNPGDVVLQAAATSAVGQTVIQLCKLWDVATVNVVRDRPLWDETENFLKDLGATDVVTEKTLQNPRELAKVIRKASEAVSGTSEATATSAKLALNCVGGKTASDMMRMLGKGGVMVTYGGMSKESMPIPVGPFIFKDIQLRGFWMSDWSIRHNGTDERQVMLDEITDMYINGKLKGYYQQFDFDDFEKALKAAKEPFKLSKTILKFDN